MKAIAILVVAALLAIAPPGAAQPAPSALTVAVVDFYGAGNLSADTLRGALTVKEGDRVTFGAEPAFVRESRERLERLPGVTRASLNLVCCEAGGVLVYVGIGTGDATAPRLNAAPTGDATLPADVLQAGAAFGPALSEAVRRGESGEDRTQGHSLMNDPAARAIQERFIGFARRDRDLLLKVLRESADARQRALAAQVVAYADDKASLVPDLVRAMSDPDEGVRNDAMRALLVFGEMRDASRRQGVPWEPFIALLESPVWSDRNKASGALAMLTASRDPALLARLKAEAFETLAEMARWRSKGHATFARQILGRIGGLSEEDIGRAIEAGDAERIIAAARGD